LNAASHPPPTAEALVAERQFEQRRNQLHEKNQGVKDDHRGVTLSGFANVIQTAAMPLAGTMQRQKPAAHIIFERSIFKGSSNGFRRPFESSDRV
jgi:hypothetical protein